MINVTKQLADALEKLLSGFSVLGDGPDESDVRHALCLMTDGIKEGRAALAAHRYQAPFGPVDVEALIGDLASWHRYVVEDRAPQALEKHIRDVFADHGIEGE